MSPSSANRRSFLALAAVPAVATLAGGVGAETASAETFPDYAPVPPAALGPALNAQGYYVGQVHKNLYWVTDSTYVAAFLTTKDGVVLFDAPPSLGQNLQRAIDEIASANGVSNKVTHIVYSHHHADHLGASALFGPDVVRVGHAETKRLLARDNDPNRPLPDVTFEIRHTLRVGGDRVELAWLGANHTPDNIYIHFPDHDTLMLVDVTLPGWGPFEGFTISEDVPGTLASPGKALSYPWKHFIGGHEGRLGTRHDMVVYHQYLGDLVDNLRKALTTIDAAPFFAKYGNNIWAAVKTWQDAQVDYAIPPVIKKYTGVLAGVDVYTASTALVILNSIRLDLGFALSIHP